MDEMTERGVIHALETYERFLADIRSLFGSDIGDDGRLGAAVDEVLLLLQARITRREFEDLVAQLPLVVRERLKEAKPLDVKPRDLHAREFVRHIATGWFDGNELRAEEFVRCVFMVVRRLVSEGEMKDVESQLPRDLRELVAAPKLQGHPPYFPL